MFVKTTVLTVLVFLAAPVLPLCPHVSGQEDPYLWLEETDSQRALKWVREQNAVTAKHLTNHPQFESLHSQALEILNSSSRIPEVQQRGQWLYNFWRDKTYPRGVYRRTTLEELQKPRPRWEVVLDLDAMSAGDGEEWVFKGVDCLPKQYRHCLVELSSGGGDAVTIREFDMQAKAFVENGFQLPAAKTRVTWMDRDTLLVATDFGPGTLTESGYPRVIKRWKRGTTLDEARTVHQASRDSVGVRSQRFRTDGGNIDVVTESLTFWSSSYFWLTKNGLSSLNIPGSSVVEDAYQGKLIVSLKEDWTVGRRTLGQGSVVMVTPQAGDGVELEVEVLVEPDKSSVVQEVAATEHGILVSVLENVQGRLHRYEPSHGGGWTRRTIPFPESGSLTLTSIDQATGHFFVAYQGFTTPPTLYHVAAPAWKPRKLKAQAETFDGNRFKVEQYWATSADGTGVPYFVVMDKRTLLNGKNPTHMFSYGGFRSALTPSYSGSYEHLSGAYGKLWLERGGVFVVANIRGGGEFGPQWHAAALKENRARAYEDFEAIAEDLVQRRITSSRHLGIEGRSNGGLLVGAAFTRRPRLYGAVVCGVPLADMKRYHRLLAGASWMAEFGDPDEPDEWAFIRTYSPYHNLKQGQNYPSVFFYTSTRDDRVHPGHARKMAAKMIDMGYRVRYYENTEGGHSGSSTNDQLAYRLALAYTHLWSQLSNPD